MDHRHLRGRAPRLFKSAKKKLLRRVNKANCFREIPVPLESANRQRKPRDFSERLCIRLEVARPGRSFLSSVKKAADVFSPGGERRTRERSWARPFHLSLCPGHPFGSGHPYEAMSGKQGGRSNDASSVNQAISFLRDRDVDSAPMPIDFLPVVLGLSSPPISSFSENSPPPSFPGHRYVLRYAKSSHR
ncbi:hypothetical protein KM043_011060 [Ampulex compressa]|nr:hypothetical protein KM043_011060 [Ampulex compressa]